jgi:glycosyltransferase involved in cell wall biosynthesis
VSRLVSVIIPTRNRPVLLRQALESVAAQRGEGIEVEAVVVNDGGTDVSPVVADAPLPVRLITLSAHRGLPAARNAGLDAAGGAVVAFCDDDDVFLAGHLRTALTALDDGADVAYTVCPVSEHRVDPGDDPRAVREKAPEVFDFPFDARMLLVANTIPVTSVVWRRGTAARFDERLPVQEDWDLWLRLYREGAVFVHVPVPTVVYHRPRDHESLTTDPAGGAGRLARFRRNHQMLMRRWPVGDATDVQEFRRHVLTGYRLAQAEYDAGRRPAHFYYERVVRVLHEAITGKLAPSGLSGRIAEAVVERDPRP